jgi:hypothetical protein
MLHLLPDLIDLVVGLSRCKGSATEIAQFTLGDLTLIAYPSFYMLLGDCQGVVGHREQDFDTGTHLSRIYLYITVVRLRLHSFYPEPS